MKDPDGLLARAGVSGDPDQDQHFLVDDRVLDRLPTYLDALEGTEAADSGAEAADSGVDAPDSGADVADSGADAADSGADGDFAGDGRDVEHVLEVGAGTGALTDRLLARADRVTAIERDSRLVEFLRSEFADAIEDGSLTVVEGDALDVELPDFDASVSNLPYGVSSEILFRLLPAGKPLVVTVQKEFAERLVADPGDDEYGRLSVAAGHYADAEIVEPVPPTAFSPPPAVESAVVRTAPRDPDYDVRDDEFFLRFVKALFTQRRKTTRNAIRNTAHISELSEPDALVDAAPEEWMGERPGDLEPAQFAELAELALSLEGE